MTGVGFVMKNIQIGIKVSSYSEQRNQDHWTPVLETIRERLIAEFNLNKTIEIPEVPVSIGELFDKYSILEIKAEKISNLEKLSHVKNELDKLRPVTERFKIDPMLYYDLINVNKELWEIEDRIRIRKGTRLFLRIY